MPAPKVVVVKPPPAPKPNDTMFGFGGREPIRKTVAPANEPREPRPPGRIEKEPTPPVTPVRRPGPTPGLDAPKPTPTGTGKLVADPLGKGLRNLPTGSSKAEKQSSTGPRASATARRHANRHARFNRTITDPTLKAWAKGAKAART